MVIVTSLNRVASALRTTDPDPAAPRVSRLPLSEIEGSLPVVETEMPPAPTETASKLTSSAADTVRPRIRVVPPTALAMVTSPLPASSVNVRLLAAASASIVVPDENVMLASVPAVEFGEDRNVARQRHRAAQRDAAGIGSTGRVEIAGKDDAPTDA